MKLLKIFITTALVLLPFGEILRFDIGNNIAIKPLDLIIILTATYWLFLKAYKRQRVQNTYLAWPLVAFLLIGFLSLILNLSWLKTNELLVSILYLIRWVSYALLMIIVFELPAYFKKKLVSFLFIDGLIMLLLGYIQYLFYPSLKNLYYLGWDEHMHRMFSVFFDPNFAGAFFVLYFIFLLGRFYFYRRIKNYKQSVIFGILLIFTLVAIFLTFSRSAILMLIVGALTLFTLIQKRKMILPLLTAIILFSIIISPQSYIENLNLLRLSSTEARIANYSSTLKIIKEKPVLGVGFNSVRYAKNHFDIQSGWTKLPSHADAGADNSFLFVLATTGFVGFLVYLWLWFCILKEAFRTNNQDPNMFSIVFISSSAGLFVNSMFINSLFFPAFLIWIFILFGIMESKLP